MRIAAVADAGLDVRAFDAPIGAQVLGADVADEYDDECFLAAVRAAVLAHRVLVFRGQRLDDSAQIAFSRRFGVPQRHVLDQYRDGARPELFVISNIGADGRPTGVHPDPGACVWHSDGSWQELPGRYTFLYGLEVPRQGADTLFADMIGAYAALDADMRARIEPLTAVHDLDWSRRRSGAHGQMTAAQRRAAPPVAHPVVRRHPETGDRCLYLGQHASRIEGWPEDEGRALIDRLNAHATQDRFVYRHRWRPHDLVMWDNRAVVHKATPFDAATEHRTVRRTTVLCEAWDAPAATT